MLINALRTFNEIKKNSITLCLLPEWWDKTFNDNLYLALTLNPKPGRTSLTNVQ